MPRRAGDATATATVAAFQWKVEWDCGTHKSVQLSAAGVPSALAHQPSSALSDYARDGAFADLTY